MREIKFRGLDILGKWHYGYYGVTITGKHFIESFPETLQGTKTKTQSHDLVGGSSISQFTGLKDKNGVDIYEGDILKTDTNINQYVKYKESMAQFVCSFKNGASTNIQSDWVVVGNIYENPELVK